MESDILKGKSFVLSQSFDVEIEKKKEIRQLILENGGSIANNKNSLIIVTGTAIFCDSLSSLLLLRRW